MKTGFLRAGLRQALFLCCALTSAELMAAEGGSGFSPDEVIYGNPANDPGLFIGAGFGFGQGRSSEPGSSPAASYTLSIEPGYQFKTGSWSRLEASAQLLFGNVQFREPEARGGKTELPINFGVLARFGYGYSLGQGVFGVFKVGVGPLMARYKGHAAGQSVESDGTLTGTAGQLGYFMVMPASANIDVTGGFSWTYMNFDLDKAKDGTKLGRSLNVNVPQLELGMRYRL